MGNKKINNLAELDREIARMRSHAKALEGKLDDNFAYLQQHSSTLMINTLLSGIFRKESLAGNLTNLLLQSERLQKTLTDLAELLIDRIAGAIDFLLNKISPKNP
jgi:hypothetical protein